MTRPMTADRIPSAPMAEAEVLAAGGVVVRADGRVAVIHRPRYDDWSLPKGKLEDGESFETGGLREVEGEPGDRGGAAGGRGGDPNPRADRRRARFDGVRGPQGPRQDRPLVPDGPRRGARRLRPERRSRRAALAHAGRGPRPPELRARPVPRRDRRLSAQP